MICEKCGHPMRVHYGWFCPKCDAEVLKKKPLVVGDLFKIMYHMEANGYMKKDDFWDLILDDIPGNDCYIDMTLRADESDLDSYYSKVAELLGVEHGSTVTMWVSW